MRYKLSVELSSNNDLTKEEVVETVKNWLLGEGICHPKNTRYVIFTNILVDIEAEFE